MGLTSCNFCLCLCSRIKNAVAFFDSGLGDGVFCAGYSAEGKDPCQGDSGGPLVMAKSSSDDTAVIIGAVSHGLGYCGEKTKPAVYAKVTKYLDWIKANMG